MTRINWIQSSRHPAALLLILCCFAVVNAFVSGHARGEEIGYLRPLGPEPHPYTTDEGRFIFETYPVSYYWDRHNKDRVRTRGLSSTAMLKYGLTRDFDIQIQVDAFEYERATHLRTGATDTARGIGNIVLRSKYNFWGNDEETPTALSIYPYISLPTHRHGLASRAVEGGVMFPFAAQLNDRWVFETTPSVSLVRDSRDRRYETQAANLLVFNYDVTDRLGAFTEFFNSATTERGKTWQSLAAVGANYALTENAVVEIAYYRGLTRAAIDHNVYLILVKRF